ncbi:GspH/FimT family pseudopilin [Methyloglobulus sp.]|uniref:GspH/FimT family pseudopilin n=1 Tax=Methyloglobulus sp. TaxID=2518622 RepID=UPI0032B833D6
MLPRLKALPFFGGFQAEQNHQAWDKEESTLYMQELRNSETVIKHSVTKDQHTGFTPASSKGFSLLEMILVLFVVILGFSVVGLNISSGNDATKLQSAARDMVSALRFAKGQALISHKETTVALDLNENSYTVSDREKVYTIPDTIALTVVTAQEELNGKGLANIRFFPDGSSSGGRIKLEMNSAIWQIDINWLTGQVELESK